MKICCLSNLWNITSDPIITINLWTPDSKYTDVDKIMDVDKSKVLHDMFTDPHKFLIIQLVDDFLQTGQLNLVKYRGTSSINETQFL